MTPHRIVFLDFDGVLNSHDYAIRRNAGGILDLDPIAGARLERLTKEAGADVVVSSTWRLGRMRTELCDLLRGIGYTGAVLGKTPDLDGDGRGEEIEMWMNQNWKRFPVESFVILDDNSDMDPHTDRLVKTSFAHGLTDADVKRAIEVLKRPYRVAA